MMPMDRTLDRRFFATAAILLCFVVFVGFARNYYLRAWIGTRPLTVLAHVHGLVMTAWVALFAVQTFLISRRRVARHQKLGYWVAGLSAVVVLLGIVTIAAAIARRRPGVDLGTALWVFVAYDGLSVLLFGGLVAAAIAKRRTPWAHKRLMLMAMLSLLPPAFGRLVAYFTHADVEIIVLCLMYASVAIVIGADWFRTRRPYAAVAIPALLIIVVNQLTYFAQVHT
jgi:hypothetical protein